MIHNAEIIYDAEGHGPGTYFDFTILLSK